MGRTKLCYVEFMDWFRWPLEQHKAVIFAAVLIAAALVAYVLFPIKNDGTANGFGPDWECTHQGQGGPTCVKKVRP